MCLKVDADPGQRTRRRAVQPPPSFRNLGSHIVSPLVSQPPSGSTGTQWQSQSRTGGTASQQHGRDRVSRRDRSRIDLERVERNGVRHAPGFEPDDPIAGIDRRRRQVPKVSSSLVTSAASIGPSAPANASGFTSVIQWNFDLPSPASDTCIDAEWAWMPNGLAVIV